MSQSRIDTAIESSNQSSQELDIASIPGLAKLWNATKGDKRVCIALLDGAVNRTHSAFDGAALDFPSGETFDSDSATAHGTHIASVIVGQHESTVRGVAPSCRVGSIPIFHTGSDGKVIPCSQVELASAIRKAQDWAEAQSAEALVINISGGQYSNSGDAQPELKDAIERADKQRTLVVAAAGNQGCECIQVPGALHSVLAVGAMNQAGEPLEFSNWGKQYLRQGILAIGEGIVGATPSGSNRASTGTSYATPIVAGVAALLLSLQLKRGLVPNAAEVKSGLLQSALGCEYQEVPNCNKLLAGRLSVSGAIKTLFPGDSKHMATEIKADSTMAEKSGCDFEDDARTDTNSPSACTLPAEILPAECGCGGKNTGDVEPDTGPEQVFAIGRLTYDFESQVDKQAMQRRLMQIDGQVENPVVFMRHLFRVNPDGSGPGALNVHESRRFCWVLEHNNRPLYVVKPYPGGTEADDLKNVAFDYLEQQGLADAEQKLLLADESDLLPHEKRPDAFAISGWLTGETVDLLECEDPVKVLLPEYDLTLSWNSDALLADAVEKNLIDSKDEDALAEFRMVMEQYQSFVDPVGDTPEKRAKNFVVTQMVRMSLGIFARPQNLKLVLTGLTGAGSRRGRYGEQIEVVRATYIDLSNSKDVYYSRTYEIDVSQPFPYLVNESTLGFA